MKVAIIGAGNVGSALATSITRAGHDVLIASRDPEDAASAAAVSGARAVESAAAAAIEADVIIPAVGFADIGEVATEIAGSAAGKPVVDVTNRIDFGAAGPEIDTTTSNAEELATLLPKSFVVKAFNTLFASNQVDPIADGVQLDGYVAGDDASAKGKVLELVSLDGPASHRCRAARSRATAGRSSLLEYGAQHRQQRLMAVGLEARRRAGDHRPEGNVSVGIPVARLNHAVLYVRDATKAAEFYGRVFGFEVVESAFGGRAVFMRAATGENHHDLGLFSVGPEAPRPPRGSVGLYHLAWEVPTIDDLAAAAATLSAEGALGGASDHGVSKSLYGADPDGNEFEIMWRVPREAWGEFENKGAVMPLDLDAELKRWGAAGAARA